MSRREGSGQGSIGETAMPETFRVTVFERDQEVHSDEYSEPVELGRQDGVDVDVYCIRPLKEGRVRLPIARKDEITMSKRQALLEALPEGMVRLTNQSETVSIRLLADKSEVRPITWRDL